MQRATARVPRPSPPALLASVLLLALVILAVAAPLRSAASGEPVVLRPERFVPIAVDLAMSASEGMALAPLIGMVDLNLIGRPVEESLPRRIDYPSLAAAAQEFRPRPRVPSALPEEFRGEPAVTVVSASSMIYELDLPAIQRLLAAAGLAEVQLPTTIHGARVTIDVPAALMLRWGDGAAALSLTQARQPRVVVPGAVQLAEVREVLLGHPLVEQLAPEVIAQLRAIEAWQTTVPVPVAGGASAQAVQVDGADALLLTHGHRGGATVLWQRNGMVFTLTGPLEARELLSIAASIH